MEKLIAQFVDLAIVFLYEPVCTVHQLRFAKFYLEPYPISSFSINWPLTSPILLCI